jgi:arylformamidase
MKIFDVTVPLSASLPIYEGDPRVEIDTKLAIANGAAANVSQMCFGVHSATHVDAPNHFIEGGRRVHELELGKLIGPCAVVQVDDAVDAIEPENLPDLGGIDRILFKTRGSGFWNDTSGGFREDFTYIAPAAAHVLADAGIKLVGIDYLSVEKFGSDDFGTHLALLEKEVVIIEGLDLREISPGGYDMVCLPLKYDGGSGDGAPARTILMQK